MERRLTAILSADVAGYSRLMGANEVATLAALKAHRAELIDGKIAEHLGRIVKLTGDGMLIEFPSVVNAVDCAAGIQREMRARNAEIPQARRIEFRIGINLGDVIAEDGDIYGDGVNIAARIEALAQPGGVAVSASVRDHVGNKLDLAFEDLGEQSLKNIEQSVRVYNVLLDEVPPGVNTLVGLSEQRPRAIAGLAGSTRKLVIAVLPFDNLSGDPEQQYFSDGITEDIIDRLAKFRILSVIGHHSSFALRGRDSEIAEVRDKLSAGYVLTGNIRRSAGRVRIAARLTDARTGGAMWADHYDRPLEDIFAVQDEVAGIIVNTLLGRVEIEVGARLPAASPASISSFEHVLQGIWHFKKLTPASNAIAAGCFQKAIDAQPGNAEAYRWLAICDNGEWLFNFSRAGLVNCLRHAAHAIELDPANAGCHAVQGFCQMWLEGLEPATASYRKALALNPGDPHVLAEMGLLNVFAGDLPAAQEFFDQAFKLNPLPPLWYPEFRAVAVFVEGRYAEALPPFLAVPEGAWDTMYALSCLGHLERRDHAIALRSRFNAAGREWDLLAGAAAEPFGNPEPRQRLIEGLKRALSF